MPAIPESGERQRALLNFWELAQDAEPTLELWLGQHVLRVLTVPCSCVSCSILRIPNVMHRRRNAGWGVLAVGVQLPSVLMGTIMCQLWYVSRCQN